MGRCGRRLRRCSQMGEGVGAERDEREWGWRMGRESSGAGGPQRGHARASSSVASEFRMPVWPPNRSRCGVGCHLCPVFDRADGTGSRRVDCHAWVRTRGLPRVGDVPSAAPPRAAGGRVSNTGFHTEVRARRRRACSCHRTMDSLWPIPRIFRLPPMPRTSVRGTSRESLSSPSCRGAPHGCEDTEGVESDALAEDGTEGEEEQRSGRRESMRECSR